jgi:hypothetical protein
MNQRKSERRDANSEMNKDRGQLAVRFTLMRKEKERYIFQKVKRHSYKVIDKKAAGVQPDCPDETLPFLNLLG